MSTNFHLTISSRAMYSTWAFHQPSRLLLDCGEGVALNLLSRIFAVETVACSHGHQDHIGGLLSLIGLRAKSKGDTGKPLRVIHPADNPQFDLLKDYVARSWPRLPYDLTWVGVEPGFGVQLDRTHSLRAFSMQHQPRATTLGYQLVEERTRLRPDIRARITAGEISGAEVGALVRELKAAGQNPNEVYEQNTLVWACDHFDLDEANLAGADLAIMDCTFMDTATRKADDPTHSSLEESASRCARVGVKHMAIAHISTRFSDAQISEALLGVRGRYPQIDFHLVHPVGVQVL